MTPQTFPAPEASLKAIEGEMDRIVNTLPSRINADPEKVEQGLVKLVLTLVELLRKLLEKQALRRMEAGHLTPDQIENMGVAFLRLEQKMVELKTHFRLTDDDLNIDLGPLGHLM